MATLSTNAAGLIVTPLLFQAQPTEGAQCPHVPCSTGICHDRWSPRPRDSRDPHRWRQGWNQKDLWYQFTSSQYLHVEWYIISVFLYVINFCHQCISSRYLHVEWSIILVFIYLINLWYRYMISTWYRYMVSHRIQMFYVAIARFPKVFPGEAAVCVVWCP